MLYQYPHLHRIPVLTKEETEAQRGHVAHVRVTSEFKERKAVLLVVLPIATLASGCPGQEDVPRVRVLCYSAIQCVRKGDLSLEGRVRLHGHWGGCWLLIPVSLLDS